MEIVTSFILYFIIWWTLIFTILPWGNRPPKIVEKGHCPSAPEKPRLIKKILINTLLTTIIWGILFYCIQKKIIDFEAISVLKR